MLEVAPCMEFASTVLQPSLLFALALALSIFHTTLASAAMIDRDRVFVLFMIYTKGHTTSWTLVRRKFRCQRIRVTSS